MERWVGGMEEMGGCDVMVVKMLHAAPPGEGGAQHRKLSLGEESKNWYDRAHGKHHITYCVVSLDGSLLDYFFCLFVFS